jgi:hypothetical protein
MVVAVVAAVLLVTHVIQLLPVPDVVALVGVYQREAVLLM